MSNYNQYANLSRALPKMKWEDHLCFCVGGKIFIITSPDATPVTASFKVSDEDFERLSVSQGFQPAPYLARYKRIYISDIRLLSHSEWSDYLAKAYKLVHDKLPKRVREGLL